MDWKDADLTAVVEQVAASHWNTQLKPAGFGSWEGQVPATQHHVRESMLPNVVRTHAALEPYVQQLLAQARAQARAQALRDAADMAEAPSDDLRHSNTCYAIAADLHLAAAALEAEQ